MKTSAPQFIIISRHGEQCSEHGLTKAGREQVKALGETLSAAGFVPDAILASYPERTQKSADQLQQHFQIASRNKMDFLHTYKFNMDEFMKSIPENQSILLIAGHEESIQCFGHYLLDDRDTAALFEILPGNRKNQGDLETGSYLSCYAHHADALIVAKDNSSDTGWALHGWVADGQVLLAKAGTAPSIKGKKYSSMPEFPEILLELPQ